MLQYLVAMDSSAAGMIRVIRILILVKGIEFRSEYPAESPPLPVGFLSTLNYGEGSQYKNIKKAIYFFHKLWYNIIVNESEVYYYG